MYDTSEDEGIEGFLPSDTWLTSELVDMYLGYVGERKIELYEFEACVQKNLPLLLNYSMGEVIDEFIPILKKSCEEVGEL